MSVMKQYDDIIKSEGDKRIYRGLELSNGLKVMVVSDPTTEKAAAAMDVNIGRLSTAWSKVHSPIMCSILLFHCHQHSYVNTGPKKPLRCYIVI